MYNNVFSVTTSVSLFFANKNYHLSITVYLERDIVSFHTCKLTVNLKKLQDALKTEIYAV